MRERKKVNIKTHLTKRVPLVILAVISVLLISVSTNSGAETLREKIVSTVPKDVLLDDHSAFSATSPNEIEKSASSFAASSASSAAATSNTSLKVSPSSASSAVSSAASAAVSSSHSFAAALSSASKAATSQLASSSSKAVSSASKPTSAPPRTAPSSSSSSSAAPLPFTHPAHIMVGYYGGWAAYSGYTPDKINASGLTVLNYAFATIGSNLNLVVSDIDYSNFSKLKKLKSSYPSLKVVISIGGWEGSQRFSDAALSDSSRNTFADNVIKFIKIYGFDGVDIDWEYPTGGGLASNISRSADKTNFGLLLKTLRAKLEKQGIADNKHYILSFAGGANNSYAAGVGLSNIAQYMDYGMIMTYDIHGTWDQYTDFNAPLYIPSGTSPQYKFSVDNAVRTWLNYGFPAKKLVMGVPFYGYAYQGVTNANNGLWQRFTSGAAVSYDTIQSKYASNSSYKKFYDSAVMVPWLYNGSTFVSYEDASSIQKKTQYALSKKLLGVGIWELSQDRNGTLLSAVRKALG
jgi:chitinase